MLSYTTNNLLGLQRLLSFLEQSEGMGPKAVASKLFSTPLLKCTQLTSKEPWALSKMGLLFLQSSTNRNLAQGPFNRPKTSSFFPQGSHATTKGEGGGGIGFYKPVNPHLFKTVPHLPFECTVSLQSTLVLSPFQKTLLPHFRQVRDLTLPSSPTLLSLQL